MDIHVCDHGSIVLLQPKTEAGRAWLADHCPAAQSWGTATVAEPRYVAPIVEGARNDGLEVV